MVMTRRQALALPGLAACGRLLAANDTFWNTKDPADWTAEEIDRLLTHSPWAKDATVGELPQSNDHRVWSESTPMGGPPGGIPRRTRDRTVRSGYEATVRWASAAPILAATKTPLPEKFREHHTIAVIGLPLPADKTEKADEMSQFASLRSKGHDLVQPGVVEWQPASRTLLFGFSREILQLGKSDRTVMFSAQLARFDVKATFELNEMKYRGALAV